MIDIGKVGRMAAGLIAALGWATIGTQMYLTLGDAAKAGNPGWLGLVNLFSYFTLWTNTLVAIVATIAALGASSGSRSERGEDRGFFARPGTRAAVTVYIIVVGLIYQTLLKGLVPMAGLRLAIDTVFHAVIPLVWPLWWLVFGRTGAPLWWRAALGWLGFPLFYGVYSIARGTLTDRWPYPFMNVSALGFGQVVLNLALMLVLFLGLGLLSIAIDRQLRRRPLLK